jgi:LysR family glycine cleavage system transcriptional activator
MRLPSLTGLQAFEAAARLLSFQAAAAELSVTPTAISHRIRRLEEELGSKLFHRQTRAIALSDAGRALLPDVREAFVRLQQASEKLRQAEGRGVLTVSTVTSFAVKWLVPRLASFQQAHSDIDVRIATNMALANFRDDGVDIAIRYGSGGWPGLRIDLLMNEQWQPVVAPALLQRQPKLRGPADLAGHTLLHVSAYPDDWQRWLTMAGYPDLTGAANLTFDESATLVQAAINGLGVALGRRAFVEADVAEGRLVEPFDIHLTREAAFYIVSPEETAERPMVAAFRDWILAESNAGTAVL